MKELRGREANIVFRDLQDVPGVGLARVDDVVVKMDRALRFAGRARAVEPERRIVPVRRYGSELILPRRQQVLQNARPFGPTVRDDDLHRLLVVAFERFPDSLVVHLVADNDACAAVLHEEAVVHGLEQGVDRDRDGPNAHHGKERRGERWGVVQHQQDPVLPVYAQRPQGVAEPADAAGERPVGDLFVAAVDGDLFRAPGLQVAIDQNARVVPLGDLYHYESPLGYGAAETPRGGLFVRCHGPLDHDRFRLRVVVEGFDTVLLAIARLLQTAEGQLIVD